MALRTFVKINSVTNLTDARYGAGMYVDLIGFNLDRTSDKYVNSAQFKEISGWISGVEFVAEFSHETRPEVLEVLKEYSEISWIEYDRIAELKAFSGKGYGLIYKMDIGEVRSIEPEVAEALSKDGILFHVVSKDNFLSDDDLLVINKLHENCKVILGYGVEVENVQRLVAETGVYGISLTGGDEIKPGLKDMDELSEILEKLELEE